MMKGRSLAIGAVVTCLATSIVPAAAGASGFPSTKSGVHLFMGFQGNLGVTQTQAISAARMSDAVSGLTVQIAKFGPAMRQANPNVQLFVYLNGELSQSKQCSAYPASWYLYSASGAKVMSRTNHNCAMSPESTAQWNGYAGWVDYVRHQCAADLAAAPLATGCFVDQISSALNSGFATATPIDPATGHAYSMSTWMNQMGQIGQAIQAFTGRPVIGNSYEGGSRYWKMPTNIVNNYAVSAFESEHFLNANQSQWTGLSYWEKNINMMIDAQAHGKNIMVGFTNAPAATQETWRSYVTASYLIGNNGSAWMDFGSTSLEPYDDPSPLYGLAVGTPLTTASSATGYQVAPGVFLRRFSTGIAVVNLSGATRTIPLGGSYLTAGGSASQITLSNGQGAVLAAG